MKATPAKGQKMFVSFIVQPDGEAWATVRGKNGTLTIQLQGGHPGDDPTITILDLDRKRPGKYKACWALQANGRLKGWLVDEDDRIKWFPERKKPKRATAKPKQKQTTKAPPVRGKAKRPSN